MTNKDLLHAMRHLDAKYTEEADARVRKQAERGIRHRPLLPMLTALGSAAACIAVLAGVTHMDGTGEEMQTLRQDIAVQMGAETEPAEQTTAASQTSAQTDTVTQPRSAEPAANTETGVPQEPVQVHLPAQKAAPESAPENSAQTAPSAVQQPAQTEQTLPDLSDLSPELSDMLADILAGMSDDISEDDEKPILVADQISGHAGETVAFSLYVEKNPGFNWFGFEMEYDARLHLQTNSEDMDDVTDDVTYQTRELPEDGVDVVFFNYNDGKLAVLTPVFVWDYEEWASNQPIDNYDEWYFIDGDGMLITFYFDIPADAKSGTVYDMKLAPSACITHGGITILAWDFINGSITVE